MGENYGTGSLWKWSWGWWAFRSIWETNGDCQRSKKNVWEGGRGFWSDQRQRWVCANKSQALGSDRCRIQVEYQFKTEASKHLWFSWSSDLPNTKLINYDRANLADTVLRLTNLAIYLHFKEHPISPAVLIVKIPPYWLAENVYISFYQANSTIKSTLLSNQFYYQVNSTIKSILLSNQLYHRTNSTVKLMILSS